jgi:hypothetical protein
MSSWTWLFLIALLCLQCLTWFEPDEVALRAMLVRWVIAYPKAVMCHIRVDNDPAVELKVNPVTCCNC